MNGPDSGCKTFSLLAVIVLYKAALDRSEALASLQRALSVLPPEQRQVQILLFDNTPEWNARRDLPDNVVYYAAPRNEGVAGAYNYALGVAQSEGVSWMLLLDQDSRLPQDFLHRMREIALALETDHEIGAIVPQLSHGSRLLSPVRIRPWGVSYLPRGITGVRPGEVHAMNSASLLRVSALRQIGGFDLRFWLDYQDASTYRKLHRHGRKVYVAGDIQVAHDLSLLAGSGPGTARFRNFLLAESAFCDLHGTLLQSLALTARLACRLGRQQIHCVDPGIRSLTRDALKRRILHAKRHRIRKWQEEMRRLAGVDVASAGRPAISVCMAAYNGERFITAQLQSILSQLGRDDEVVVVDDASTDGTRDRVRALGDNRIRLLEHRTNRGVSRTFEDAIRAASGRLLFLSDQDDLWDPRKVSLILNAFASHPMVTLIATDNALIDASDSFISNSYFTGRGGFRSGLWANLMRNRFGGCTMAFRSELIGEILPLPHKYDVLHDVWIGVRNSLSGHPALYIPEALVWNRRHETTATGRETLSLWHKIRIRFHLLLALAEFRMRRIVL
jgi:GT2 family glycosyltransferase